MAEEPKVQITRAPGVQGQFGKGRFSYQNSRKSSAKIAIGSGAALTVAVCVIVLSGSPKKDPSDMTSHFLGVRIPEAQVKGAELQIPEAKNEPLPRPSSRQPGKAIRLSGPEVLDRPRNLVIPPGSMLAAVLLSGASDGPVKAELREPLVVGGETLLEAGTILVGSGQSTEARLMVHFRQAVFRDGSTAKIEAQALDAGDKIAGIKGSQVGRRALKLAASIGLDFAGGLSQGLEDSQGEFGAVVTPPSMKNALLNGAARASIQEGQDMMNEYRNQKPSIEVPEGTEIEVLFDSSGS